jgi:hypothetical protein
VKRAKQKQTVQSTVYGGNALKADVFKAKEVVDMLLDEQEEEDLKHRQQAFLRTRRVKRSKATVGDEFHNGTTSSAMRDEMMIDTTSTLKKKESISPLKPKKSDLVQNGSAASKSAPQNIFATIKTSK